LDRAERSLQSASGGRSQSETSFLQGLLRELGGDLLADPLSPADLFRAVLNNRPFLQTDFGESKTKAKELEPWRPISLSYYSKNSISVMNRVTLMISNPTFHSRDRQRTSRSIAQVLIRAKPPF